MNSRIVVKQEQHNGATATPERPTSERSASPGPSTTTITNKFKRSPSPASSSEIVLTGFENKATKRLKVTQQAPKDAVVIEESMRPAGQPQTRKEEATALIKMRTAVMRMSTKLDALREASPAASKENNTKTKQVKPEAPARHYHRVDGRWVTCPHKKPCEGCGDAYWFG